MSAPDAADSRRYFWRCDRISALLLIAFACGVAWQCRKLPLGSLGEPGPAAWPLLLALLLLLLALAIFAGASASSPVRALQWGEKGHALAIIGAGAFAASTLETLGFRLTILAVLLFLIGVVERRRLLPTLLVSFSLSFGMHFVFSQWLRVPLPVGLLGVVIADTLANLANGFGTALSPGVLVYALLGCVIGTLVGMMPGLGPLAGISLLLPLTYGLTPTTALVLLAGIYYGSQYGGSTTSILMRLPGEASSVMTCIDGHAMTRKGRGGAALAIAAIGSFVAGTLSVAGLMLLAPPLADFALRFGPPETFSLLVLGLMVLAYMGGGSIAKSLAMAVLGLLLGTIGIDMMTGFMRFQFGVLELADGIGLVPIAVGLFGISEILLTGSGAIVKVAAPKLAEMLPTRQEVREATAPIGRGTVIGFLIGIIPGSAHIIASFVSYAVERKLSKRPQEFGQGAVAGVAGPESANNAAACGAFVPMLALGVPSGPIPAVMLAALMVHGVAPGPLLIEQQPGLFWGFIASMYVGNVVLLILNLPLIGLFLWLLRIPYSYLYPAILAFCLLGVYAVNQSIVEVWLMVGAGVLGYALRKLDFEVAPMILGLILSPMVEMSLRQSLGMSNGSYAVFVTRPLSGVMLGIAVLLLASSVLPPLFRRLARP